MLSDVVPDLSKMNDGGMKNCVCLVIVWATLDLPEPDGKP